MYDEICFDLDGTLTDPAEGITHSVAYALAHFGIEVPDRTALYPFIGPPLAESFRRFYGFSEEDAARAVEEYRVCFRREGMFENAVYPGIRELLEALRGAGKELYVVTSKPVEFARQILEHFGLLAYFTAVVGPGMEEHHLPKSELFARLFEAHPEIDPARTVMVGDRRFDVTAAKDAGIEAIGVLYGYGSREELTEAGATALAATVAELSDRLLEGKRGEAS